MQDQALEVLELGARQQAALPDEAEGLGPSAQELPRGDGRRRRRWRRHRRKPRHRRRPQRRPPGGPRGPSRRHQRRRRRRPRGGGRGRGGDGRRGAVPRPRVLAQECCACRSAKGATEVSPGRPLLQQHRAPHERRARHQPQQKPRAVLRARTGRGGRGSRLRRRRGVGLAHDERGPAPGQEHRDDLVGRHLELEVHPTPLQGATLAAAHRGYHMRQPEASCPPPAMAQHPYLEHLFAPDAREELAVEVSAALRLELHLRIRRSGKALASTGQPSARDLERGLEPLRSFVTHVHAADRHLRTTVVAGFRPSRLPLHERPWIWGQRRRRVHGASLGRRTAGNRRSAHHPRLLATLDLPAAKLDLKAKVPWHVRGSLA
mmetsp:Transcript_21457/g.59769  ORF Transcript_21457/g.59769 Transcript_21457/m.59769 type:complete len:376 (-) Transcript_21457:3-1130(-)